jgi:hypothetical protein
MPFVDNTSILRKIVDGRDESTALGEGFSRDIGQITSDQEARPGG